jgi:hypothetical protein
MQISPLALSSFFHTVEGIEFPSSCKMIDGQPVACFDEPIKHGNQPNLSLLVDVLRSDIELSKYIREWLANLLDPGGKSEVALVFRKRTKKQMSIPLKRKQKFSHYWHIAEFVEKRKPERMEELRLEREAQGKKPIRLDRAVRSEIIDEACEKFGVRRTIITAAVKSHRAAIKAHDELVREQLIEQKIVRKK